MAHSRKHNWLMLVLLLGLGVGIAVSSTAVAADAAVEEAVVAAAETAAGGAESEAAPPRSREAQLTFAVDNIMLFVCAVLVLFMQAGFALVEVGMNSAKNTVNILSKNVMDLAVGVVLFFALGYALMYPGFREGASLGSYIGIDSSRLFAISAWDGEAAFSPQVDFLFQAVFAATAATIVSGAVAGRMKFGAYLVYSGILTGLIYPISGSWKWGGGWLDTLGFHDFAGSVLVHAVGGFAGLAGAIFLGPRMGRFTPDGKSVPMPGHNITFAALGVFILWVGWYGFNSGSVLAFSDDASIESTMSVAVNTTISSAMGAVACLFAAWAMFGKPDLTMALNGALGGLVGITANADLVSNQAALAIGLISGLLVLSGVLLLDRLKIDDPVGAWPVHGLCGIWGCLAAAAFGGAPWMAQIIGTAAVCAWAFGTMSAIFAVLKLIGWLRVTAHEETTGLDLSEHGMHAYLPEGMAAGALT